MRQPQGRRVRAAVHHIKGSSGYSSFGIATIGCMLFRYRRWKTSKSGLRRSAVAPSQPAAFGRPDFAVRAGKGSRTRAITARPPRFSSRPEKQDGWRRSEQSVDRRPHQTGQRVAGQEIAVAMRRHGGDGEIRRNRIRAEGEIDGHMVGVRARDGSAADQASRRRARMGARVLGDRDRRGKADRGSGRTAAAVAVLVAVRSPIAWAVLFIAAKKVLVLPDMTPISLRANERILPAGLRRAPRAPPLPFRGRTRTGSRP